MAHIIKGQVKIGKEVAATTTITITITRATMQL
jgi:hypothetical protein